MYHELRIYRDGVCIREIGAMQEYFAEGVDPFRQLCDEAKIAEGNSVLYKRIRKD